MSEVFSRINAHVKFFLIVGKYSANDGVDLALEKSVKHNFVSRKKILQRSFRGSMHVRKFFLGG